MTPFCMAQNVRPESHRRSGWRHLSFRLRSASVLVPSLRTFAWVDDARTSTGVRHWRINWVVMVIIETAVFTRQVLKLLSDEQYRELQLSMTERPDMGDIIKGSGGLRKVRWMTAGQGKRGGIRVIYCWAI